MTEFDEETLEALLADIYFKVEKAYNKAGIEHTLGDIYEKTCELLQQELTVLDPSSDWEVDIIYDSMKALYDSTIK